MLRLIKICVWMKSIAESFVGKYLSDMFPIENDLEKDGLSPLLKTLL
jgi:hypothetical protein